MVSGQEVVTPELWVVSELYYPEETSTGYVLTVIAEGLARTFRTGVICSQPTYAARGTSAPWRERHHGVEIVRFRGTRLDPKRLRSRLLNALTISVAAFFNVWRRVRRGNVVIVVTNPPFLPLVVRIACRLRGARVILLVHDVYQEVLEAAGFLRPGSWPDRFAAFLSRILYRGFDRIVVIGRDMRQLVAAKVGARPELLPLIPNWGELDSGQPGAGNALRERFRLHDKFVVHLGGNIGRTHDIDTFMAAASELRDDAGIHFLVVGSGAKRPDIEEAIASGELPNVTLLPQMWRDFPATLAACDVAMVALLPGMKGVSVPSRTYNILGAGKPVIGVLDADSEVGLLLHEERAGWIVPCGDAGALAAAIRRASAERAELRAMGERGRAAVERSYTAEHAIAAWTALIHNLVTHV